MFFVIGSTAVSWSKSIISPEELTVFVYFITKTLAVILPIESLVVVEVIEKADL